MDGMAGGGSSFAAKRSLAPEDARRLSSVLFASLWLKSSLQATSKRGDSLTVEIWERTETGRAVSASARDVMYVLSRNPPPLSPSLFCSVLPWLATLICSRRLPTDEREHLSTEVQPCTPLAVLPCAAL